MKNSIIIVFALLLVFTTKAQVNENGYDLKKLENIIDSARIHFNTPGLAVGIVHQNKVIFNKGFGNCIDGKKTPVNENTLFGIASNTKAFTAMAISILVEQGKLSYDDKVIKHLPWFALYNDYTSSEMTIRDLLTHHSGLATFSGDLIWYASNHSREEIVKRSRHLKPVTGFREKFGYSNIHYLAAGLVIEKLSGMSYDEFVKKNIFDPLEMSSTNTSIKKNPDSNVAQPHAQREGKNITIPYVDWDNIAPAGSINSSVNDMCKWISSLLKNTKYSTDQRIISDKTFTQLLQPVTTVPVSGFSRKMHPGKHLSAYAMGFNLFDYHNNLVINHSGGLDGMISHLAFVPEKDFGFVILSNAGNGLPGILLYDILDYMLKNEFRNYSKQYSALIKSNEQKALAAEKEEWKDATIGKKTPLDPEAYEGIYKGNVYGSVTVTNEKGKLKFKMDHSPTFNADLNYWKDDLFWFEFKEHPSLPKGTVKVILNDKKNIVTEIIIDCPNPDFDFTELDLIKERN